MHVRLRVARKIIAFLSATYMHTYIHTYIYTYIHIETISEMRCGISCLALRRSATIVIGSASVDRRKAVYDDMQNGMKLNNARGES